MRFGRAVRLANFLPEGSVVLLPKQEFETLVEDFPKNLFSSDAHLEGMEKVVVMAITFMEKK